MKYFKMPVLAFFMLLISQFAISQHIARGIVYEDLNQNNKKDTREKGIPNVSVSNGVDVVQTNAKGEYQLPVGNDNIVFVIKPGNYNVPLNQFNQPQFYYIHKPNGSPVLTYPGVAPTGKLPKSIDFALLPKTVAEDFKIFVFGDPQAYNENEINHFYNGIVKELEGAKGIEFGMSLGDLVGDRLDLHLPYKKAIQKIGLPWYNVIGNHDLNFDVKADSLSDESFEKEFGPATYAFNHGKVHFIIADNILYPDPRGGNGYWGGLQQNQLRFIENNLKYVPKDYLIVFAAHIPLSENDSGDPFNDQDRNNLFALLKDFPYTLSLSAHTHYQSHDFLTEKDGWMQEKPHHHYNVGTTSGDWYSGKLDEKGIPISTMRDGTRKGYATISFTGNQYVIDYKAAGKPSDYYFEIYAPKVVVANKFVRPRISANFFIGSSRDSVFYRINNGTWSKMTYRKDYDLAYMREYQDWDFTHKPFAGSRPSAPIPCNHIWFGTIPTRLEPGQHTIEIKAHDMFGRVFTQKTTYMIVKED
jgi:hypothetical protein